jgi:hypothetical protein
LSGYKKIIKFDTFIKYLPWKSENKRPRKIWKWTFYKCPKMSRGLKLFLKKHEISKVKHNGKVPLKFGNVLLPTGNLYFYKKRV